MNITNFLSPQHAIVGLRATGKAQLLHELTRRAAAALGLPADQISDALLKREALGSTGTGGGIAIPHARLPGVGKPFGIFLFASSRRSSSTQSTADRSISSVCCSCRPMRRANSSPRSRARREHCASRVPFAPSARRWTPPRSIGRRHKTPQARGAPNLACLQAAEFDSEIWMLRRPWRRAGRRRGAVKAC